MLVGTNMYSYYTTTYSGRTIHIIKGQGDSTEDVQISLMAYKYDTSDPLKIASDFSDSYLESNGWTKVGVINGGIFNGVYANGLEKAFGVDHEMADDYSLDGVMALAHDYGDSNTLTINTQATIRANSGSYRGAVTAAFGLLKGGAVVQGDILQGSYSSVSGRSIIGKDSSGVIYFISTPGVTGSSGLTGAQCVSLAQSLGLTDAVALDGGGSVSLIYQGSWKISTSREIKNVIGMYVKQKSTGGGGGTTAIPQVKDTSLPIFEKTLMHKVMVNGVLSELKEIKVKKGNQLINIDDIIVYN